MTTRAYDYIVTVSDASNFVKGNSVVGLTSSAFGEIVAIEGNNLKVIMGNVYSEFVEGESLSSQSAVLQSTNTFIDVSDSIDGVTNTFSLPSSFAFEGSVQVYADSFLIPKDRYVLDNGTITFNNINTISSSGSLIYEEKIFPEVTVNRLILQIVTANTEAASFISSNLESYEETAVSQIQNINSAPYILEKNSTQQTPLVKLYTIYYPGEWYPPNANGNPSKSGAGYSWPYKFPLRYAEVVGETFNDFNYIVSFGGEEYKVVALNSSDIRVDISSTVNTVNLEISNFDGDIAQLVENSNIVGYNSSTTETIEINEEQVLNIDSRTVPGNINYDADIASLRGINSAWDYSSTISNGDTWTTIKTDSRDLLGGIVEIKLSYAKFLDYWPEFSSVRSSTQNSAQLYSTIPYRVGDSVTSNSNLNTTTIESIKGSNVYFSDNSLSNLGTGSKLLIKNPDADKNSYIQNNFIINKLSELSEVRASFELTNWLQNSKSELPKRKFYTTTCPWQYKGRECKYPSNGTQTIVGSNPSLAANGFFTYNNVPTEDIAEDICSKTIIACRLRNNLVNFGGFPGVKEE